MMRFSAILTIFSVAAICSAVDSILATQIVKHGSDTLISAGGSFELGFFSLGNAKIRYLGIWYKKISVKTVVWVANRNIPINNTTGVLMLTASGILNLLNNTNGIIIWSSSNSSRSILNPIVELLDNGNLVIKEKNNDDYLWQSFDYPTDTQLPEMKLGKIFVTGLDRYLSSWKSSDDPAPGDFTYGLDPTGYPHFILRKDQIETYQTGPWNGARFSGRPNLSLNKIYTHKLIYNKEEMFYMFELINSSVLSRFVLNERGEGQRWTWVDRTQKWEPFVKLPTDSCDTYKRCGAYGSCNINNGPGCDCLEKFKPKNEDNWGKADWSDGCVRRKPLNCKKRDGFHMYSSVKVPDTQNAWFSESMNLEECGRVCLKNCSCMGYTCLNITKAGSRCLQWFGDLFDIRELSGGGQDLYVRVAFPDSDGANRKHGSTIKIIVAVLVGSVILGIGLGLGTCIWKKKKNAVLKRSEGTLGSNSIECFNTESQKEDIDLPFLSLPMLAHATNHFAVSNKLGQGGFGPVFKGVLEDGQEIAVKRLSETSRQGNDEFLNEVKCIAKLQHRNLVRLLGYCIQGEDTMLIYEYMPNKSLDCHIFDKTQSKLLDWPRRFNIIDGIARGLLYLHQDSRVRIIHRDLKAGNILLDKDLNPKISDFGLARSFMENEIGANTNRVVGTYGYMSPEYAVDGIFSVKSDVYSFGVLVLEIVSGSRNRGFIHKDHRHNLLGHAWRLHKEGRSVELMDQHMSKDSDFIPEVQRSIHIGLLCVQQSPEDRPNMSSVVLMLLSDGELPMPTEPGFFTERNITVSDYSSYTRPTYSAEATTSALLQGR